jgi:hypothetical protein
VYAGESQDSGSCCAGLSNKQLLHRACQLTATLFMVQEVYEQVVSAQTQQRDRGTTHAATLLLLLPG